MDNMALKKISIKGYKSIKNLENLELKDLNILVGPNGAGKSNFISFFKMLHAMVQEKLQLYIKKNESSIDRMLSFGVKQTTLIECSMSFGENGYSFQLGARPNGEAYFEEECTWYKGNKWAESGHSESILREKSSATLSRNRASYILEAINSWKIYHFHDTSMTAGVRRECSIKENKSLAYDCSNLAAYLYQLKKNNSISYQHIRKVVKLAVPFFEDFELEPTSTDGGVQSIQLFWKQKGSDYIMWPQQLSDGSLRFICLVTVLLQPNPPSLIIIDEPELGLHPYALTVLGSLLKSVSSGTQIIVSTQSVDLLNEFSIDDLIILDRKDECTTFTRPTEQEFAEWLKEYSIGDLWLKNVIGGRPE